VIDQLTAPPRNERSHLISGSDHRRSRVVCHTERKIATVLFTDIKGSMQLERSVELEEWWTVISGLFEVMCDSMHRFEGWIGNFTGDGIKAVFEDQEGRDGHAERACDAALSLHEAIKAPAREVLREQGLELSLRIGINSGEVLTGTIGAHESRYYTATGYAVSLAKRIEGLAIPGTIYLSEATAGLLGPRHELRDLGVFALKGAELPVGVFELMRRTG
jgi:class 3 adenylate cyclase